MRTAVGRLRSERGSMLLETVIALTFLAIAVGALMTMYASNILSLRHVSTEATAYTLADRQMESYKVLPYASVMLSAQTIPDSGTDPYHTANAADATIPSSSGQVTGGTATMSTCTLPLTAQPQCAAQTWTGPEGKSYRVDSYVVYSTPSDSRQVKQVTVVVREVTDGAAGTKVWGRATSIIDQANPPQ